VPSTDSKLDPPVDTLKPPALTLPVNVIVCVATSNKPVTSSISSLIDAKLYCCDTCHFK